MVKNGPNSTFTKQHCKKLIASQLKRMQNNQSYHKDRLHTCLTHLMHIITCQLSEPATNVCFTQMSAKKGIQVYGERALNAIITEYKQLEDLSVFTPIDVKTLPAEDRKGALHAIDLIKEKRTGKLKDRTVVDGRKQRPLYDKYEISSPALSQDVFLASLPSMLMIIVT